MAIVAEQNIYRTLKEQNSLVQQLLEEQKRTNQLLQYLADSAHRQELAAAS